MTITRLRAWIEDVGDQFWLRPALVVVLCIGLAQAAVWYDRVSGSGSEASGAWSYSGGAEGARSLLGAIASSTVGVAGTIFSITIAALSLASGQMGPRLLRNFVRDPRNQIALGIFLGAFAYALMVLRTVRTVQEIAFVPHLGVTGAMILALLCIGTLIWFVHHIATSINLETVIEEVHADLRKAIAGYTRADTDIDPPSEELKGVPVSVSGSNYLQAVDAGRLADWAARHQIAIRMQVRPGTYVPAEGSVAVVSAAVEDSRTVFESALTFGRQPAALQDLEYPIRQLSEMAVRALSPGINDPFTAGSVLERFGDALCRLASRHLPSGAVARDGRIVLVLDAPTYDGLCDAMFHMIRQNAAGSPFVLIRLVEVLSRVNEAEHCTRRRAALRRHADLTLQTARADTTDPAGLADIESRFALFTADILRAT